MFAKHIASPPPTELHRLAVRNVLQSPVVLALVAGAVAGWCARRFEWISIADPDLMTFAGTLAQIACTMLGFLLAALAVLASINHTHLVKMMKQTGHYRDLLLTLFTGCVAFFACLLMSMAILFGLRLGADYMALLLGANVAALVAVIDAGRKLWMVLSNLRTDA